MRSGVFLSLLAGLGVAGLLVLNAYVTTKRIGEKC